MSQIRTLRAAVGRVCPHIGNFDLHPLSNSADNRIWYVVHADGRFLAKLPDPREGLRISTELELEIMQASASAGISAAPVGYDKASRVALMEELPAAAVLSRYDAATTDSIASVSKTLQRLHRIAAPEDLRRFEPPEFAAKYCEKLGGENATRAAQLCGECEQLTRDVNQLVAGESICHNDLHCGNLLVGDGMWLIDFEYAVRAAPIVDIASYAAFNELDAAAAMSLARECLGNRAPASAEALRAVMRIHLILGELWEIARSDNNAPSGGKD